VDTIGVKTIPTGLLICEFLEQIIDELSSEEKLFSSVFKS